MFLKLTEQGSGATVYVNLDRVERMAPATSGTRLFYAAEQCEAHVKESPEQIVALLAAEAGSPAAYFRAFTDAITATREHIGAACRSIAQGR